MACRSVGGESDRDARGHDSTKRHGARTQLGVADRTVGDLCAGAGEDLDVARIETRAVRGRHVGSEEAETVEPLHRPHAVGLGGVGNFLLALGQVRVNRHSELIGKSTHLAPHLGAAGIHRVGRQSDVQQAVVRVVVFGDNLTETGHRAV